MTRKKNAQTWSYADITQAAEIEITTMMKLRDERTHVDDKKLWYNAAFGVFELWDRITKDHQIEADYDRLAALAGYT